MSTNVPYRLEFSVEVPGTPEQVWAAVATARGISAWFLPTEMEEREGGALHISMGPDMGSDGHVTAWEPPRRLVYEEDWAALMGKDPDELSPMTSEFVVEARSGGTCVVRVTASGFGTGADWEQEWWDDMGRSWRPSFDVLRLYLAHFPGQEATQIEVSATHAGDADALWDALRTALGLTGEGDRIELRGAAGLRGRPRVRGATDERARLAVRKAIGVAVSRIGEHDPALGRLLGDTVRTGHRCRYEPDPGRPVTWLT